MRSGHPILGTDTPSVCLTLPATPLPLASPPTMPLNTYPWDRGPTLHLPRSRTTTSSPQTPLPILGELPWLSRLPLFQRARRASPLTTGATSTPASLHMARPAPETATKTSPESWPPDPSDRRFPAPEQAWDLRTLSVGRPPASARPPAPFISHRRRQGPHAWLNRPSARPPPSDLAMLPGAACHPLNLIFSTTL